MTSVSLALPFVAKMPAALDMSFLLLLDSLCFTISQQIHAARPLPDGTHGITIFALLLSSVMMQYVGRESPMSRDHAVQHVRRSTFTPNLQDALYCATIGQPASVEVIFNIEAGVIKQFYFNFSTRQVAFVFDLRGYLGCIIDPDPQPKVLFRQVADIAPYRVARVRRAWDHPKEFINADLNLDRSFSSVLCCDRTVPSNLPLAYAKCERPTPAL